MTTIHNLGFPRIGARRELKRALETYWRGETTASELQQTAATVRERNWAYQRELDWVPVFDFSLYDHVLDTTLALGNLPERYRIGAVDQLDSYFRAARGKSQRGAAGAGTLHALEMTKWFDTNYHYLVPEFESDSPFELDAEHFVAQLRQARALGVRFKPVLLGPVTYVWLGAKRDERDPNRVLERLLPTYRRLLQMLIAEGATWVQIDEPLLVTDLSTPWQRAVNLAYEALSDLPLKLLLTTYFGPLKDNLELVTQLPVSGVHLDAIRARSEAATLAERLPDDRILSLGVVDGRNVWKCDQAATLSWLAPLHDRLAERLWLAPSCSLLHVPVDLAQEDQLVPEVANKLAFAVQKLAELKQLSAKVDEREPARAAATAPATRDTPQGIDHRSPPEPTRAVEFRRAAFERRAAQQSQHLRLPTYPTTTIGSFPQTTAIRAARAAHRVGKLDTAGYEAQMRQEIRRAIEVQEQLGLDVLVHGEAERNDMVEYFAEQLDGFAITRFGWVQSYGSRCVKPPIVHADVTWTKPMTVAWTQYAQSLTDKPVKGMLTGPVTLLNWSFVREDRTRREVCVQLARAVREEVAALERAGVTIVQIDEAALREGLPLRTADRAEYLDWAVAAFRVASGGAADSTQIHTHMCYSRFDDIMPAIVAMDADVITIETSRSNMKLLDVFDQHHYPNAIGPGVYDIHSPNVPTTDAIVGRLQRALRCVPDERLWVNPDCGLKTREWDEVIDALRNMVEAALFLRRRRQEASDAATTEPARC